MIPSRLSKSPFAVGQSVVYRPTQKGLDANVMAPNSQRLVPGQSYRVAAVIDDAYLVPEGQHQSTELKPHPLYAAEG
jgi:hypothetical protein